MGNWMQRTVVRVAAAFIGDRKKRRMFRELLLGDSEMCPVYETLDMGESFKEYVFTHNVPEKLSALKAGLDDESLALLDLILYRMVRGSSVTDAIRPRIARSALDDLRTEAEKEWTRACKKERATYETAFSFLGEIIDRDVFFFHHGLRFAPDKVKEYIKDKDAIDGGAFIGDSALLLERYYSPRRIYSFETSPAMCGTYRRIMRANNIPESKFELIPMGLSDRREDVRFPGADDRPVPLVDLDSIARERNLDVGFIKLDIEGMGLKGLRGMIGAIQKDRPVLSLSIYHNPEEFFDTKPLLDEITGRLDYRTELKQFRPNPGVIGDVCLFAYPRELE